MWPNIHCFSVSFGSHQNGSSSTKVFPFHFVITVTYLCLNSFHSIVRIFLDEAFFNNIENSTGQKIIFNSMTVQSIRSTKGQKNSISITKGTKLILELVKFGKESVKLISMVLNGFVCMRAPACVWLCIVTCRYWNDSMSFAKYLLRGEPVSWEITLWESLFRR